MIVQPDFTDHWKTNLLVRLCGKEDAVRCVLRFWAHCQNRKKWKFQDMNPQMLASICRWDGDAQIFWDAMAQTFMDVNNGSVVAHEWDSVNASLIGRWKGGETNKKQLLAKLSKQNSKATSLATTSAGSDQREGLDGLDQMEGVRVRSAHEPKIEYALKWLKSVQEGDPPADYTEKETRLAFKNLSVNGWMWGKNAIADWRAALEVKIEENRNKNGTHSQNHKPTVSQLRNATIIGAETAGADAAATVARRAKRDAEERAAKAATVRLANEVAGHGGPPS